MTNAKLELQISDEFNSSFEAYLKETARNVIQEVIQNPIERKMYLTKKEACAYLSISYATIQKLILMGLPSIQIDGKCLFSKISIDQFMKSIESK